MYDNMYTMSLLWLKEEALVHCEKIHTTNAVFPPIGANEIGWGISPVLLPLEEDRKTRLVRNEN